MAIRIQKRMQKSGDEITAGAEQRPATGARVVGIRQNTVPGKNRKRLMITILAVHHRLIVNTVDANGVRNEFAGVANLMHEVTQPRVVGKLPIGKAIRRMNRQRMIVRIGVRHCLSDLAISRRRHRRRLIVAG